MFVLANTGGVCTQRIRIGDGPLVAPIVTQMPQVQYGTQVPYSGPPATVSPPPLQLSTPTPAGTQAPPIDPYGGVVVPSPGSVPATSLPPGTGSQLPSNVMIYPPPNSYPWVGPNPNVSATPVPPLGSPQAVAPPYFNGQSSVPNVYGPAFSGNPYGEAQWPGNSGAWPNSGNAWPSQAWSRVRDEWLPRLIEHPRFRHTYLFGSKGRELGINDTELATTLTLPNFLLSQQPLRISPGFVFHFWDGPDTGVTGVDLPSKAYSAYLSSDFASAMTQPVGIEANFTIGMYTDFRNTTSDSIRLTGVGLGWIRLDNTTTLKVGIEYLDRLDKKLFPAVGLFMMPSPDTKLDLYFPRPKFARRLPNYQNFEVWGYVAGEYGGGSWTIEHLGGLGDQVDINDIRVLLGAEWMGPRGVTGFIEGGYVFDRELFFKSIGSPINIDDTFMVCAGLAF